jgi:hypothetical protein
MDKKAKIQAALDALPNATDGDWWIDDHRGEMHNDPIGSVKLAKQVDGGNLKQREANRKVISAARDLAEEVIRLRELTDDCLQAFEGEEESVKEEHASLIKRLEQ